MTTNIAGNAGNGYNDVVAPSDGEPRSAASVQVPFQGLADRDEVLRLKDIITRHGNLEHTGLSPAAFAIGDLVVAGTYDTTLSVLMVGSTLAGVPGSKAGVTTYAFTDVTGISIGCAAIDHVSGAIIAAGYDATALRPIVELFAGGAWARVLDGTTTPDTAGTGGTTPRRARFANGIFAVIIGDAVYTSADGTAGTWSKTTPEAGIMLSDIQYNATRDEWVVATSPSGVTAHNSGIWVSDDNCATWTQAIATGTGVADDGIGMQCDALDWGRDGDGVETLCYAGEWVNGADTTNVVRGFTTDPAVAPASIDVVLASANLGGSRGGQLMYCRGIWYVACFKPGGGPWPIYGHLVERVMVRAKLNAVFSGSGYTVTRWAQSLYGDKVYLGVTDGDVDGQLFSFPRCGVLELDDPEGYP
jgi:hypothetical protein